MKGRISLLILLVVILVTLTSCGSGTKKGSKELQQLREQVKTLQEENSELQKENKELSKAKEIFEKQINNKGQQITNESFLEIFFPITGLEYRADDNVEFYADSEMYQFIGTGKDLVFISPEVHYIEQLDKYAVRGVDSILFTNRDPNLKWKLLILLNYYWEGFKNFLMLKFLKFYYCSNFYLKTKFEYEN